MSAALSAGIAVVPAHMVGSWGPAWWFLLIPLFWVALIAVLFAIFGRRWRRAAVDGYGPHGRRSPLRQAETTLAERFAKGDIDEAEYRARLEVVRANASAG